MADRVDIKEVRAGKPVCKLGTSVRNSAGDIRLTGAATLFAIPLAKD